MIRSRGVNSSFLAAIGLTVGVALSVMLYFVIAKLVDDRARQQFENQASKAHLAILGRVEDYADILNGLNALFQSAESISRDQFRRYIGGLNWQKKYPGVKNLNYARVVAAEQKPEFEATVRQDHSVEPNGYPAFSIKPPGPRASYHVITYIEPMPGFEDSFGFDIASNPSVANALNLSRDTGKLTSSGRLIPRDGGSRVALAMRFPLYQFGMPVSTIDERRAAYRGSLGAGFDVKTLMTGALDSVALGYMRFRVFDIGRSGETGETGTESPDRLLFDSLPQPEGRPASTENIFTTRIPMEVGGRKWEVSFSASQAAMLKGFNWYLPWLALIAGLFTTALLYNIFYSLTSSRRRAIEIATVMTKDLRESEASLADAQQIAHMGNWQLDAESRTVACSAETLRIFGLSPNQTNRAYGDFTARMDEEDRVRLRDAFERGLTTGQEFDSALRIVQEDGSSKWVQIMSRPAAGGKKGALRGTVMDITERKRIEDALHKKNIELENSNQAKDRFLANMSHELRTPLNAIIGFTGMLLMKLPGPLTTDQDKQLKMIRSSARHSLSLINDLLDLTKIESGKVSLSIETFVCQDLLAEVVETLRPLAEQKGLGFKLRVPDNLISVRTDRRAMSQILINLINNAIKFTEAGEVNISVLECMHDNRPTTEIRISDTGVGIKAEDQAKLFQAFTQVDATSTKRFEGTGLGLHLSQKLSGLIGARIHFTSEYGVGTTFTLALDEA
ncbi:hypothetical protein BH11PSE11_BH11PSE11_31790 [soil metagenome]